MFDMFKRKSEDGYVRKTVDTSVYKQQEQKPRKKQKLVRSFMGARNTAITNFNSTFARINQQLKVDYIALVLRARSLYKNNETVAAFVNQMIRNIIGNKGFILNVTSYNPNGQSDVYANETIERFWAEYQNSTKKYVSADGQMNGVDFDRQVIFNYLIDGEVFILKHKDPKSKFGIRYSVIDSLDVDTLYNVQAMSDNTKVVMGIKLDVETNRPISYFIRKNKNADFYLQGQRIEVPADEIIHIFKPLFANQTRGFTPLSPVMLAVNALDQYKRAEIQASLLNAVLMGVYQKNSADGNSYDDYDQEEIDNSGNVASVFETGCIKFAPDGYSLKTIQNQHPNSNVPSFCKGLLKSISAVLGLNYNNLNSDYSETSYSSMRAAAIQDELSVKELGQFIIDHWKNEQYEDFLKYLLLSDLTALPYSKIDKFMQHDFQVRKMQWIDPQKEINAIQMRLQLGLTNPIQEIHAMGVSSPQAILDGWKKWSEMLKNRNLKFDVNTDMLTNTLEQDKLEDEV